MKTKEKSLRELLADIQKASELERYDPPQTWRFWRRSTAR